MELHESSQRVSLSFSLVYDARHSRGCASVAGNACGTLLTRPGSRLSLNEITLRLLSQNC